jgi:hypothetical protein
MVLVTSLYLRTIQQLSGLSTGSPGLEASVLNWLNTLQESIDLWKINSELENSADGAEYLIKRIVSFGLEVSRLWSAGRPIGFF